MLRSGRSQLSILGGLAIVLMSGIAAAQAPAAGPPGAPGGEKKDGYGYEFSDDPLNAGGFGPNDATIRVRAIFRVVTAKGFTLFLDELGTLRALARRVPAVSQKFLETRRPQGTQGFLGERCAPSVAGLTGPDSTLSRQGLAPTFGTADPRPPHQNTGVA